MKNTSFFFLCILFNGIYMSLSAQDTLVKPKTFQQQYIMTEYESNVLIDAEYFFFEGDYQRALPLYLKLHHLFPGGIDYAYKTAICYLNSMGEKEKAVEYLEEVQKKAPETQNLNFYLGEAYYFTQHFEEGVQYLKKYIDKKPEKEKAEIAKSLIKSYENAKTITKNSLDVKIENIGDSVNTEYSEFAPIVSPDESTLIYTYVGENSMGGLLDFDQKPDPDGTYYADIFISHKVNGKWSEPSSIGDQVNTLGHDEALSLSADGQHLFIFRNRRRDRGDIYMSNLEGETWSTPKKLEGEINTKYWESNASLSVDGKTLYFASNRPEGFGGKDIYKSEKKPDGKWGTPVNMGGSINTESNEDAPFIHPDGRILYFSSEGHNSMGGYDVFVSYFEREDVFTNYQGKEKWAEPKNIGYPINTPQDDIYYLLNADGSTGYLSSGRSNGMGQQDIYSVKPGTFEKKPVLFVVKGKVFSNGKPAEVKITIKASEKEKPEDIVYKSTTSTGNYFIYLPIGQNFTLSYEGNGLPSYVENINTIGVNAFTTKTIDLELNTPDYLLAKADTIKSEKVKISTVDTLLAKAEVIKKETYKINTADSLIAKAESKKTESKIKETNKIKSTDSLIAKTELPKKKIEVKEKVKIKSDSLIAKAEAPKKESKKETVEVNTANVIAKKLKIQRVYFDFNKSALNKEYTMYVDNIYTILKENKELKVEIIGNTDSKGSDAYNMELARKRAKGIANYLEGKGIEHNRIQLYSKGKANLLISDQNADGTDNPTARAKNRRVEFKIITTNSGIEIEYEDNQPIEISLP